MVFVKILGFLVTVFVLFCNWMLFVKAGKPGWAGLIPVYNTYVMFDIVYGNGISFLKLLIPFYNIYVAVKFYMDFARCYGQEPAFGLGLLFVNPVFSGILAFSDAEYQGPVTK